MANLYDLAAGGSTYVQSWSGSVLRDSLNIVINDDCMVYGLDGRNTSTSAARWIMLFDSASLTVPANGTNPLVCFGVPPTSATPANVAAGNFGYGVSSGYGRYFKNGLWLCVSTTDVTLTLSSGADVIWTLDFVTQLG